MSVAPYCQPPDQVLREPLCSFPAGSVDCHAHICGPDRLFPYSSNRIYTPHDALLPDYESLLNCLGLDLIWVPGLSFSDLTRNQNISTSNWYFE